MKGDTGRFSCGVRGSIERRLTERKAIIDAWLTVAMGAVEAELASGWLGPEHSPLGEAAHRAAVERRIVERRHGDTGPVTAAIVAGRHLLTIDAVCDEFFRAGATGEPSRARAVNDNGGRR